LRVQSGRGTEGEERKEARFPNSFEAFVTAVKLPEHGSRVRGPRLEGIEEVYSSGVFIREERRSREMMILE